MNTGTSIVSEFDLSQFSVVMPGGGGGGYTGARLPASAVIAISKCKKQKQVCLTFTRPLLTKMRWVAGDRLKVLVHDDGNSVLLERNPDQGYKISKSGKRVADLRLSSSILKTPEHRTWYGWDALTFNKDGTQLLFDLTALAINR